MLLTDSKEENHVLKGEIKGQKIRYLSQEYKINIFNLIIGMSLPPHYFFVNLVSKPTGQILF